jgi:hypothetical protein
MARRMAGVAKGPEACVTSVGHMQAHSTRRRVRLYPLGIRQKFPYPQSETGKTARTVLKVLNAGLLGTRPKSSDSSQRGQRRKGPPWT